MLHRPHALRSLSGKFSDDSLEGSVVLEYADDSFTVGFARGNRLAGVLRSFHPGGPGTPRQMNMTTARTGDDDCSASDAQVLESATAIFRSSPLPAR